MIKKKFSETEHRGNSLVVQWLRPCSPNVGGLGLIPGQGTRSHCMPKLRVHMPQPNVLHATTKDPTCCSEDLKHGNKDRGMPQLRHGTVKNK